MMCGKRAAGDAPAEGAKRRKGGDGEVVVVAAPQHMLRKVAAVRQRVTAWHRATRPQLPALKEAETDAARFRRVFDLVKCVHFPGYVAGAPTAAPASQGSGEVMTWQSLEGFFAALSPEDRASWCIETEGDAVTRAAAPGAFLAPEHAASRGYCSFLIQHDKDAMFRALSQVPVPHLPYGEDADDARSWRYGPSIWVFFGRNPEGGAVLEGRGEHTDSVSHDGTWHYQLSGTKIWYLRPTGALVKALQGSSDPRLAQMTEATRLKVVCREGDVLVVNTRLWWHRTVIPPQATPSVSYARDFFFPGTAAGGEGGGGDDVLNAGVSMQNVEGLYATQDIDAATVLFTEADMPDKELHRSKTDANCEVVELEDGLQAVVSTRPIEAGEFFCVPESDDEDDSDGA